MTPSRVGDKLESMGRVSVFRAFAAALVFAAALAGYALIGPASAPAEAQPTTPPRLALVVWQSQYETLDPLGGTQQEAELIADALELIGFQVTRASDLDQSALKQTFKDYWRALDRAGDDAVGFVYFTGHGLQHPEEGDNYLLAVDADIEVVSDLPTSGFSLQSLIDSIKAGKPRFAFIVIDACRNVPDLLTGGDGGAPATSSAPSLGGASKGLRRTTTPLNTLVAYATDEGKLATEGVYAPLLAFHLVQPGRHAQEVFSRVQMDVASKSGFKQLPWTDDRIYQPFCFNGCPAQDLQPALASAVASDEQVAWLEASNTHSTSSYKSFLEAFPDGKYAANAKAMQASLPAQTDSAPGTKSVSKFTSLVSGSAVSQGEWEYLGALRAKMDDDYHYFCDATAISPDWVITAARCIDNARGQIEVVLGASDVRRVLPPSVFETGEIIKHPNFGLSERNGPWHDIALIKLERPWTGPVARLSGGLSSDPDQDGGRAFSAGFDFLGRSAIQTMLPMVEPEACKGNLAELGFGYDPLLTVCFGDNNPRVDETDCVQGAGGPVVTLDGRGQDYQVSVVSFGEQASCRGYGTRLSLYRSFISGHVPDAIFVTPQRESAVEASARLVEGLSAFLDTSGKNVEVDVLVRGQSAADLREGDSVSFEITSNIEGQITIFDISADGNIDKIFPLSDDVDNSVSPGETVRLPQRRSLEYKVAPPFGDAKMIALITPPDFDIAKYAEQSGGDENNYKYRDVFLSALTDVTTSDDPNVKERWAAGYFDYTVSPAD